MFKLCVTLVDDNSFNVTHNLYIRKLDLVQLLEVATMNQLFFLMVSFTNRSIGVVMVPLWVHSWQTHFSVL